MFQIRLLTWLLSGFLAWLLSGFLAWFLALLGFCDGGFGFFHFTDGLSQIVLSQFIGGVFGSLLRLGQGIILRLLALGLLAGLLFECLGDVLLAFSQFLQ